MSSAYSRNQRSGNVCYFLNIILDWFALFQMYVQTMYTEERPSKGIPACFSMRRPVRANLICGFVQTFRGFEQICCAPELGDEEEQHRGEWGFCELLKICRALAGCHKTWRPCRQNRMVNHYISAANTQEENKRLQRGTLQLIILLQTTNLALFLYIYIIFMMKVNRHFCCCGSIKRNISLRTDPAAPHEMCKAVHSFQPVKLEIISRWNMFCKKVTLVHPDYRSSRMLPLKSTLWLHFSTLSTFVNIC